jgi:hypothetical protein
MKQNTRILLPAVVLLITALIALRILVRPQHADPLAPASPAHPAVVEDRVVSLPPRVKEAKPVAPELPNMPAEKSVTLKKQEPPIAKKSAGSGKKVIQDPVARDALALVGADPAAEQYWFAALNNPALSQSERQDLVDDLNEEGLPDPKHPTEDDLPVLMARIEMLEEARFWFGGDVYDWEEPYRDLTNLVAVALGGGKPVD